MNKSKRNALQKRRLRKKKLEERRKAIALVQDIVPVAKPQKPAKPEMVAAAVKPEVTKAKKAAPKKVEKTPAEAKAAKPKSKVAKAEEPKKRVAKKTEA